MKNNGIVLLLVLACCQTAMARSADSRPNIILLFIDDDQTRLWKRRENGRSCADDDFRITREGVMPGVKSL